MDPLRQTLMPLTMPYKHICLFNNQTSHTMSYENNWNVRVGQVRRGDYLAHQRLAEVMDIHAVLLAV